VHQTSIATVTVKKRFEYDHAGRLVKTYQQNNTDSEILLAQNSYNELGTLVEKKLHSTNGGTSALQTVNYAYNIRGWLTSVNDPNNLTDPQNPNADLFAMKLHYETAVSGLTTTADQEYNGNISAQVWQVQGKAQMGYGYQYDDLNQLSLAKYGEGSGFTTNTDRYNEWATYDLNGNILTMSRNGKNNWSSPAFGPMDNITMAYNGNKLIGANDAISDITNNQKYDFSDFGMEATIDVNNASTHEYLYDQNGNMIEDKNKHMTVAYNYLNLPTTVDFGSGNKIEWAYTVSGAKLRKTVYTNGSVTLTQDYVSGFVYKNGSLDFFSTETGRVKNQSGALKYQYTLSDHLGNTRVMFADNNGSPQLVEESHYYAFGMRIEGLSTSNPDNKFTYNGKELEDDHGLNWYHYGARFYDAQIGRWHTVDPMDEFHSPYVYVGNDPVNLIDPDGQGAEDANTTIFLDKATPEDTGIRLQMRNIDPGNVNFVISKDIAQKHFANDRDMLVNLGDIMTMDIDKGMELLNDLNIAKITGSKDGSVSFVMKVAVGTVVERKNHESNPIITYSPNGDVDKFTRAGKMWFSEEVKYTTIQKIIIDIGEKAYEAINPSQRPRSGQPLFSNPQTRTSRDTLNGGSQIKMTVEFKVKYSNK
jgi:RHS repeat-associated protein